MANLREPQRNAGQTSQPAKERMLPFLRRPGPKRFVLKQIDFARLRRYEQALRYERASLHVFVLELRLVRFTPARPGHVTIDAKYVSAIFRQYGEQISIL